MASEVQCSGAGSDRAEAVSRLIRRIERHDVEAGLIAEEMKSLGLDQRQVKKILATKKTLDALIGSGLVPEGASL